MEDLIIVNDSIIWMERYDEKGNEVENYQLTFDNVGLYFWIKKSKSLKLVRISAVFERLPK